MTSIRIFLQLFDCLLIVVIPGHIIFQTMCSKDYLYNLYVKENAYITVVGLLLTKFLIMPFYAKFNECPRHVKCNLYESMDCPIIEFASAFRVLILQVLFNNHSQTSSITSMSIYLYLSKRDFVARVW